MGAQQDWDGRDLFLGERTESYVGGGIRNDEVESNRWLRVAQTM